MKVTEAKRKRAPQMKTDPQSLKNTQKDIDKAVDKIYKKMNKIIDDVAQSISSGIAVLQNDIVSAIKYSLKTNLTNDIKRK